MTINEEIIAAVTPIVPVCVPDSYDGEEKAYCVFNYEQWPECFGDDGPTAMRYLVQVHYYLPKGENPIRKKRQICDSLWSRDFTYPSITNASDEEGQHWAIECEWVEAI